MATPTSHPRPSPQKQAQSHLTPASAASPPAAPSSAHSNRTIHSPAQQSKKSTLQQQQQHRQNNGANSAFQYSSPAPGGTPMSRSGTNNTTMGAGVSGSTPMARTATNGSVAMARTGTNNSSIAGRTPVAVRAGRATSAGSTTTTSVGANSPAITAAATMLMEGVNGGGAAGHGSGIVAKGLTPQDGAGLGLGLTPLGGAVTGPGGSIVSGLAGMPERDQEEERRRRLEAITELLGERWGWVGQEGVERCARRIGFECLWEEGMGGEGKRVLSIAGEGVLIEVSFMSDVIVDVGLSFPSSQEGVGKWVEKGASVLKKDLTGNIEGYARLEPFVRNLQRLRTMDKLSGEGFNCFDAMDGIFRSLERIYDWELNARNTQNRSSNVEVMCSRSGHPQMHANGCVGLILQYWKERRLIDMEEEDPIASDHVQPPRRTWSILMECEACSAEVYTPMRISDQWISADVEKSALQVNDNKHISRTNIDWLNVSPNHNSSETAEAKLPEIRFVARFEPRIIVPLQLAIQICDSVSWPINQSSVLPTTYEAVLFSEQDARHPPLGGQRIVEQAITSSNGDSNTFQRQRFTLFTQQNDYAQMLTSIPFKHPMQIVDLLPSLRQWALASTILLQSFTPQHTQSSFASIDSAQSKVNGSQKHSKQEPEPQTTFQTLEEEFADFLSSPPVANNILTNGTTNGDSPHLQPQSDPFPSKTLDINVAFALPTPDSPSPRFTIQFSNPKYGNKIATVAFSVGLNGTIEAVDIDDGRPPPQTEATTAHAMEGVEGAALQEATQAAEKLREQVKKVLEISESVGVLVEWLCR